MSWTTEYGSLKAANAAREAWAEWRCPVDDDKRLKKVAWVSDTPEGVRARIEADADEDRAARDHTVGQVALTDDERDRIDFSKGRANVLWARSIKALAEQYGVSDWTAYVDPTLTVDEHRGVMEAARSEGGGARDDGDQRDAEREANAAAAEQAEGCDHARDHCEHGDPDACEFLTTACGYDESEVAGFLTDDRSADPTDQVTLTYDGESMTVRPETAGALQRSWAGYKGALGQMEGALADLRAGKAQAQQAFAAINAIRDDHGQDDLHPDRLHQLLDETHRLPEATTLREFHDPADEQAAEGAEGAALTTPEAQGTLGGGTTEGDRQAAFDVAPDTRQAQGREARVEAEQNQGGIMADTRAGSGRGQDEPDAGDQGGLEAFGMKDADQGGLGEFDTPDDAPTGPDLPAEIGEFSRSNGDEFPLRYRTMDGTGVLVTDEGGAGHWVVAVDELGNSTRLGFHEELPPAERRAVDYLEQRRARDVRQDARDRGNEVSTKNDLRRATGNQVKGAPAMSLADVYDSIEEIQAASRTELGTIEGVGPSTLDALESI